jgi:hypothetical protein
VKLSHDHTGFLDHKPLIQGVDPFHLDGAVLGDIIANIDTDFTSFASVNRYIGRFVGVAIIYAIRFRTVCGAERTVLLRTNVLVNFCNVVHGFSKKLRY